MDEYNSMKIKFSKPKILFTVIMSVYLVFCGVLVYKTGILTTKEKVSAGIIPLSSALNNDQDSQQDEDVAVKSESAEVFEQGKGDAAEVVSAGNYNFSNLRALNAAGKKVTLGSSDKETGYKLEIVLSSKGASIESATLSEYYARDANDPYIPLKLIEPVEIGNRKIQSLASDYFHVIGSGSKAFPLNLLNWELEEVEKQALFNRRAVFSAIVNDATGKPSFKIKKVYSLEPESFDLKCKLEIENLTDDTVEIETLIQGPAGIGREGFRGDMRTITAAFVKADGTIESIKKEARKLRSSAEKKEYDQMRLALKSGNGKFTWAAITNKYFTAIMHPLGGESIASPDDIVIQRAQYFDADPGRSVSDEENLSFSMKIMTGELSAQDKNSYDFSIYIGPKDRDIFGKNENYKKLQYYHTIHFLGCCCPAWILNPMAFFIMDVMKWLYTIMGPLGNYGVVIMIIVAVVRLLLHPLMKKSQVSMMKMQKLSPKVQEIQKKYANNKAEMNKKVMELYREQGFSPISGFLPMFLQMPILIALYSAIYASIELRGAPFLPVWITDLSVPDALVTFSSFNLPLIGKLESFNLLPILLAVAMFAQQKLNPSTKSAATSNSQMAQQQKMMMWMMPIMMLFIFYKMPSGLNLYFMSSTAAGVFEQYVIRKHIKEKDQQEETQYVPATSKTGGKVKKKKPKPFFKNTM